MTYVDTDFTRGWCLQETLLSRRLIYPLEGGVLIVGSNGYQFESGMRRVWDRGESSFAALKSCAPVEEPISVNMYLRHISDYGCRLLTREHDSFDAIRGYFNRLPWPSLWGVAFLPMAYFRSESNEIDDPPDTAVQAFCRGLLWERTLKLNHKVSSRVDDGHRETTPSYSAGQEHTIPSWSWIAKRYGVTYRSDLFYVLPGYQQHYPCRVSLNKGEDQQITLEEFYAWAMSTHKVSESIRQLVLDGPSWTQGLIHLEGENGHDTLLFGLAAPGLKDLEGLVVCRAVHGHDSVDESVPNARRSIPPTAGSTPTMTVFVLLARTTYDEVAVHCLTVEQRSNCWRRTGILTITFKALSADDFDRPAAGSEWLAKVQSWVHQLSKRTIKLE
jgi:hypothetical protein